jgi:hypothetical protein
VTYEYPHVGPIRSHIHRAFRPRWALGFGFSLLGVLAASVAAIVNAIGRRSVHFPEFGVTLWGILAAYWGAGILCGAFLSLAYPLIGRRWGAAAVGFGLGFITYASVGVLLIGIRPLVMGIAAIPAVLIGGGLGLVFYDEAHSETRGFDDHQAAG